MQVKGECTGIVYEVLRCVLGEALRCNFVCDETLQSLVILVQLCNCVIGKSEKIGLRVCCFTSSDTRRHIQGG